jgi:hypothetical protein
MLITVEPVLQANLGAIRGSRRAGRVGRSVTPQGPGLKGLDQRREGPVGWDWDRLALGKRLARTWSMWSTCITRAPSRVECPLNTASANDIPLAHGRRMRIFAHDESLSAR